MRHLCDSNVLIALVLASHPLHEPARRWFDTLADGDTVGLCRQTQITFLRLLTTEAILKEDTQTNAEALAVWHGLTSHPRSDFLTEEPAGQDARWAEWAGLNTPSPKVWMDAYLAAFAMGHSMALVTFDRGFEPYRKKGLNVVLPAQQT
jgi:toxin-antitoxin system PIN domain toxin